MTINSFLREDATRTTITTRTAARRYAHLPHPREAVKKSSRAECAGIETCGDDDGGSTRKSTEKETSKKKYAFTITKHVTGWLHVAS